jgi:D-alanyl-D-alanine carboxypeptidase/D-alanyl-D-alanine-endopeptidase (penicillin-binding protein 4)
MVLMRNRLVLLGALFGAQALAAQPKDVAITKILTPKGQAVTQSVLVTRLSDGKTLYEKDPDQLVSPASVTKVITTAAVLAKFSPVHTFKTPLYHTGVRKGERVQGDLVVVGDGDPFLVSEKLWQLAADIKNLGIREFTGDLIIDNTLFDRESRDESRRDGAKSSHNAYDAPVSAFAVNFNTVAVAVAPSDGGPAAVNLDPYPLNNVVLQSSVKTGGKKNGKALDVKRVGDGKKEEKIVVTGSIGTDMPMQKIYRSVGNHVLTAGEYLRAFLNQAGVTVRGAVKEGKKPASATYLIELESYEMRKIVAGLNTFSNNFIADVLVKRLGAAFPKSGPADQPGSGSYANGIRVISDFLRKDVGIKTDFVLENGSGLATENRLSARQVNEVLAYMERHMEFFPEFLASMPATGWDGTLKKRFGKGDTAELRGLIRAKSGTLTVPVSVAGLAGYFRHPKHGICAFTLLENGRSGESQPSITDLRDKQDQVLVAFMNDID